MFFTMPVERRYFGLAMMQELNRRGYETLVRAFMTGVVLLYHGRLFPQTTLKRDFHLAPADTIADFHFAT